MNFFQGYWKKSCKILKKCNFFAEILQESLYPHEFFQDFNVSNKILARLPFIFQCFFIAQNAWDTLLSFSLQNCKNLAVSLEPSVSRRFRRRQEWSSPKGWDNLTLVKKFFLLYFYSDKLSHYKTYDFRKFFITDVFKLFRLQYTFNRCEVHQILPLMVDYACFLVKCTNYQNEMCIQKIYFLQDLERFLKIRKILQESCKKTIASKNLTRMSLHPRIWQELNFL